MDATRTRTTPLQPSGVYRLPEEQRQAILGGSDSAQVRKIIHAQRENFRAQNNGFEFGEQTKT